MQTFVSMRNTAAAVARRSTSLGMTQLAGGLMAAMLLALVALAGVLSPIKAEARSGYPSVIAGGTNTERMCGNCHSSWDGGGQGNAGRMNYYIWTGGGGTAPTAADGFALYDIDMDGTATGLKSGTPAGEMGNAIPTTRPADTVDAMHNYADKDNDGCILLYSRNTEIGIVDPPVSVMSFGYIGAAEGFRSYGPKGWDIDDNDATLVGGIPTGCDAAYPNWPTVAVPATTFSNAGSTADSTPPGKIADLKGSSLVAAALPLVWTAPADDGLAGVAAHSYDLKYSTSTLFGRGLCSGPGSDVAGATACNPRDTAHWRRLWNIPDVQVRVGGWNAGITAPLMRALYEPVPTDPGSAQVCNSVGASATGSCPAGASFAIKVQGDALQTNVIGTALYWVAIRTSDGVLGPTALTNAGAPAAFENLSPVSNIVGITAGVAGAAITSFTPSITTGTSNSVTVTGLGLTATSVTGVRLINAAGAVITGTITTPANGTSVVANFDGTGASGSYTLETLNGVGATTAAWVDAVSVGIPPPILSSISPPVFGQGAINKTVQFFGSNLSGGTADFTGTGITPDPATLSGSVTPWLTTISVSSTATPGNVSVTTLGGGTSAPAAYTITAAPSHNCSPPPNGTVGVPYSPYVCTASGVAPPFSWTTSVPDGLSAVPSGAPNFATLTISGTPTTANPSFTGQIRVVDNNSGTFETLPTFNIAPAPALTVTSTAVNGTITSTNPVSVPSGGTTTVTGTANADHYFTGVSGCGGIAQTNTNQATTTFSYTTGSISAACSVTANFAIKTYTVTTTAVNGTITPVNPVVNHGATATFTGTATANHYFTGVSGCGGIAQTNTNQATTTFSYTTAPVTAACTVTANFALMTYTVTTTAINGTMTPVNPVVNHGATATFTGTANANHYFTGVSGCGGTAQTNTSQAISTFSYTTGPVTAACTVTASFAIKTYIVTPSEGTNAASGTITPATAVTVNHGSATTFTVTPNSGFTATVAGTCGGTLVGTAYTTNAVTADCTVIASYNSGGFNVTSTAVNGTITSTNPIFVPTGGTTTVTGTANANHYFTGVSGCGGIALTNTNQATTIFSYTTGAINAACSVTANFAIKTYTVTTTAVNGSITPVNPLVNHGATATFSGTANVNHYFAGVSGCGGIAQTNTNQATTTFSYTTGPVTAACTVTASFAIKTYTVTPSEVAANAANGSITPATVVTVNHGATTTFTVTPNSGFTATVAGTCGGTLSGTNYVTNAVTANCTVIADYNSSGFTVTTTAVNGTITSPVNPVVPTGETTTVTGTANANHYFAGVSGCGGTAQTNTNQATTTFSYTTAPVTAACTVTANFAIKTYIVTPAAGANGAISPATAVTVNHGATTIFTVTPNSGFSASVGGDCGGTLVGTAYTTNAVTADCTVAASFNLIPGIDLQVPALTASLNPLIADGLFTASNTVTNVGSGAAGSFTVRFYLSPDMTVTGVPGSGDILLGLRTIASLGAGTSNTANTSLRVPGTVLSGMYYLGVIADTANTVIETDEANNNRVIGVTVRRDVDLVMGNVSTTATTVGAGTTFQINNTETNVGTTPMTVTSNTVRFYLSLDNIVTGLAGSGDILIGSRTVVGKLGVGASSTALTTVKVPSTIFGSTTDTSRTYYIGAIADAANAQKFETNNLVPAEGYNVTVATATITVFRNVNLIVSNVSPAVMTIGANESFSVSSTVKNIGTTPMSATSTTVRFFLVPTAGGTVITLTGSRVVTATAVGVGEPGSTGNTTLTVPATTTPGSYWIRARVDATNTQLETNELDNEFTTATTLSVTRDVNLVISSATTGATTVVRGTGFNVLNTESNIGTTKTTASTNSVRFYLSATMPTTVANAKLGVQIGARLVGALNAGGSNTVDTVVTVPLTMTPNTYYISVVADTTNAQVENNEADNFTVVVGTINVTM